MQNSCTEYSTARAFCFFSLMVMIGALLASSGAHPVLVGLASLLPLLSRPLCGWPIKAAVTLSLALLFSFVWGQYRQQCTDRCGDELFNLARLDRVRLIATVEQVKEKNAGDSHSLALIVAAKRLYMSEAENIAGKILVQVDETYSGPVPVAGDLVELSGSLRRARPRQFSFQFDEVAWLARQGVMARMDSRQLQMRILPRSSAFVEDCSIKLARFIAAARRDIVAAHIANLGQRQGGLFTSMVLGDRVVALDDDLKQQFARIGLSHLLAASGLNLTIIVTAALFLCRFFKPSSGWLSTWLSFACVVLFTSFAGAGPSVSRAAMMCLIALWAKLAFVKLGHGNALAIALLIALTLDPQSVADVGLQLSYGATFGIIYIYPLLEKAWLSQVQSEKNVSTSYKLARFVGSLSCVVIAAQLAVLPVQLNIFQQLSLLVVPANLLAEPVVVPLTIVGFISSIMAVVAHSSLPAVIVDSAATICFALDWLAQFLLGWLTFTAGALAAMPAASMLVARPQAIHIVIYYAIMAVAIAADCRPKLVASVLIATAVLLCLICYIESPLLEIFCSKAELIVNSRNRTFSVLQLNSPGGKNREAMSYVRYLKSRGLIEDGSKQLNDGQLYCAPELDCMLRIKARSRNGSPSVEILSNSSPSASSGLLIVPRGRRDASSCFTIGSFATRRFIPGWNGSMPFSMPLATSCECAPAAYFVSLRL